MCALSKIAKCPTSLHPDILSAKCPKSLHPNILSAKHNASEVYSVFTKQVVFYTLK